MISDIDVVNIAGASVWATLPQIYACDYGTSCFVQ